MELINQIKELFERTPSDLEKIKDLLSSRKLSEDELAELAVSFTSVCSWEYQDALEPDLESVNAETMRSNYIVAALNLLLTFGLNPNTIVHYDNVLWNTMWIDAPNVAASTLRLLLENGGDPNHCMSPEDETIFEFISSKVSYDEYTHDCFHTVQCWLLLMAYGACFRNNEKIPLTMLGGHSIEIFKNFELFDYLIEPLPPEPGTYGNWTMHIFNTETKERVAVY